MILSLCVVLVTYIFNKGAVAVPYNYAMAKREQAKLLALSGIQVAISQLAKPIIIKQKPKSTTPTPPNVPNQPAEPSAQEQATNQYIERLVPSINRWQTFNLTENKDGVDGQIKISISSEDGKININEWYDFDKHEFKSFSLSATPPPAPQTQPGQSTQQNAQQTKPGEKKEEVVKLVLVSVFKDAGQDLMSEFEKFLKERQYRLDDVTELLQVKGFESYKHRLFYEPPTKEGQKGERPMYLSDIFTVWSGKMTLDPWLLSDSVAGMLGLKRVELGDTEKRKKLVSQAIKEFKPTADAKENWKKVFEPLYGKDFSSLPKGIEFILHMKFAPSLFSVLSYGKVGDVTQKLLAILESKQEFKEDTLSFIVTIKKVIWL